MKVSFYYKSGAFPERIYILNDGGELQQHADTNNIDVGWCEYDDHFLERICEPMPRLTNRNGPYSQGYNLLRRCKTSHKNVPPSIILSDLSVSSTWWWRNTNLRMLNVTSTHMADSILTQSLEQKSHDLTIEVD